MVANQLTDRRGGRREDRERQATYERDLRAALVEIDRAVDDEDARLRVSLPPPAATVGIAVEPRIELWQRQPQHDDWLRCRARSAGRRMAADNGDVGGRQLRIGHQDVLVGARQDTEITRIRGSRSGQP